jgi:Tfp pilus assembly protein PilN
VINKINLSSNPFRNRTLPYVFALLLVAFSVAGAVLSFARLNDVQTRNEIAKKDLQEMQAEVARLNSEGEKIQQQLTPEQRTLLIGAHKLVANKEFGWSRLFADIESLLPGSVSVSRISVENVYKTADGRTQAQLDFGVLSRDYQSVITMIENMNNSGTFQASLRGQDRRKSETITYTEYTLHLIYTPRVGFTTDRAPASDVAQSQGGNQ